MNLHVINNDLTESTYRVLESPSPAGIQGFWQHYNSGRKYIHVTKNNPYRPSTWNGVIPTSNLLFTKTDKKVGVDINGNTYYLANLDDTAKKYPLMKFVFDIRDRSVTENKIPYQASTWTTYWRQSCDVLIDSSVIRPVSGTVYFRIKSTTPSGVNYVGFSIGPSTGNQQTRLWTSSLFSATSSSAYPYAQLMSMANPGSLQVLYNNQTYYTITSWTNTGTADKRIFTIYWSPDLYEYR